MTQTLITIVGIITLSLVAIGQYLAGRQKGWQNLAERRAAEITDLTRSQEKANTEREELALRIDTMEKMVAYLERQNHLLQVQLDRAGLRLDKSDEWQDLAERQRTRDHPER